MTVNMTLPDHKAAMIGIQPLRTTGNINPYQAASLLEQQGDIEGAEKAYMELLNNDFNNCVVMASLGMNYAIQGKHGLSNLLLSRALEVFDKQFKADFNRLGIFTKEQKPGAEAFFIKLKKSEIMNAIGTTWKHENKLKEARYWFERAQSMLPTDNPDIQNNLATLYINEGKPGQSMEHLERALKVDPNHGQAHWNRSLALLEMGDYEQGFKEYHWGKRAQVRMTRKYANHEIPEWDGSPGKVVVVHGEQGIGDEILFASLLPEMIRDCKEVIFDCHKKLHRLFCNSFPMIDIYATREDENITWPVNPNGSMRYPIDATIAIGDLPKLYRKNIEDFPGQPYIRPTPTANMRWAEKLNQTFTDGKPVIGINWIGGHKKTRLEVRSLTLEQMLPILQMDAHFVSLQYTECSAEIAAFEAKHGIKIHEWKEASQNEHYDETAGLVANLDLVITCCSSVVHLAGSMGVDTWVLTPSRPAWRYRLDLDYMPWYGRTVTLFRQQPGTVEWEPVVLEVAQALSALVGENHEKAAVDTAGPAGGVCLPADSP